MIVEHGMQEMLQDQRDVFYYVTVGNENYAQPSLDLAQDPDLRDAVIRGLYRFQVFSAADGKGSAAANAPRVQLLGSGALLNEALAAAAILAGDFGVAAPTSGASPAGANWRATAWHGSGNSGSAVLAPIRRPHTADTGSGQTADHPFVRRQLAPTSGPIVAVSDYVRAVPEAIRAYLPEGRRYLTLGTDGFGRSDTRAELRAFFEVDRSAIVLAAIHSLHQAGQVPDDALQRCTGRAVDRPGQSATLVALSGFAMSGFGEGAQRPGLDRLAGLNLPPASSGQTMATDPKRKPRNPPKAPARTLRSRAWFNNPDNPGMTALYLERQMNFGLTLDELHRTNRPVIGIAQTGSDLSPCNRHHLDLASRVRDGIRDAGGIPIEFPVHPIQETGKRPTAGLDRNLTYLSLVECLYGYYMDGVVLTTGCDKTTPAMIMGAATVDIPAIVLSGGPMLNGYYGGGLAGSGTVVWFARQELAAGRINYDEFLDMVAAAAPSIGHCNTMGTALSMNSMAEALGMSLPGCASIPGAVSRARRRWPTSPAGASSRWCTRTCSPSKILTLGAFENAIVAASALGASTNCPPHVTAIARHAGVDLKIQDWDRVGYDIPLLCNVMPAGEYLGEEFHRAGGVPAVMHELLKAGKLTPTR